MISIFSEVQSEDDAGTTTKTLPTRQTQRSSDDPNPEPSFRLRLINAVVVQMRCFMKLLPGLFVLMGP
jgi:hypothetical protein